MNNHFHLLASAPDGNMSEAMGYFLRELSRQLTFHSGRINQTWGGRFFRSRLNSYNYFMHAYKYVYRNPVEAGICTQPELYPYSTLHGLLGNSHLLIPVEEDTLLFEENLQETLSWLNRKPEDEDRAAVKKALRKTDFKLSRNSKNAKAHPLEDRLY